MTTQHRGSEHEAGQQSGVAEELKHDADHLKGAVGAKAKEEAESRKGQAAHVAGSASSALNTAADDLRNNPDAPDWMASALQQAARSIERLADQIDRRSIDQLGEDVSQFARSSPGTFLTASAAAGFAAARVLRAGMDKKRQDQHGGPSASTRSGQSSDWPADENIMPTESGNFTPAYGSDQFGKEGVTQ